MRIRFGRRMIVITHGYRLHGLTSFLIRRAEYHASRYVVSGNLSLPPRSPNKGPTTRRLQMPVQQPVLTRPHGDETVPSSGGSSVEMKVESSQSRGEYGTVMWTVRAGEEPPLHTHSREDELLYVVQGKLIARVGDARVEVGPGAYAALPRGVPHTIEVVGDQATLLLSFVPGGLARFLVPRKGEKPDPAAFGLTFP